MPFSLSRWRRRAVGEGPPTPRRESFGGDAARVAGADRADPPGEHVPASTMGPSIFSILAGLTYNLLQKRRDRFMPSVRDQESLKHRELLGLET